MTTTSKRKRPAAASIPAFRTEAEEAGWWDKHPDVVAALFERGVRSGSVTRGAFLEQLSPRETRPTTIRLLGEDVARARLIAHKKGIRYQTYLKMLIHEALLREEKAG